VNLPLLHPPIPSCMSCDLHNQGDGIPKSVGIPTRHLDTSLPPLSSNPALIYVGRNPGAQEDERGQFFVGKSGHLLQASIIGGISAQSKASIYLTNAVKCYTVNNDNPPARSYTACSTYLLSDIISILTHHKDAAVRVLVLLGGEAVKYVHERVLAVRGLSLKKGFSDQLQCYNSVIDPDTAPIKGQPRPHISVPSFRVICMYHPSFLLRNPNAIHPTVGHNQLVLDALSGISVAPTPPVIEPTRPPATN